MRKKLLEIIQLRDAAFIERFCDKGTFLGEDGKTVMGVCRTLEVNEMLTFMHEFDALLLEDKIMGLPDRPLNSERE